MPKPRELHDHYFKQAKAEGYVARSAYKLLQIHERFQTIRPGETILDLGCSPGSWIQAALPLIGPRGVIVGIDLKPVTIVTPSNVRTLIGDAFAISPEELKATAAFDGKPRNFTLILSDMAPNTAGVGDDLRSARLCRRVLELARTLLQPNGRLVMKVLEGEGYAELLVETKQMFRFVKGHRPDATREVSREIFIVAEGYNAPYVPTRSTAPTPEAKAATAAGWGGASAMGLPPHKRAAVNDQPRSPQPRPSHSDKPQPKSGTKPKSKPPAARRRTK